MGDDGTWSWWWDIRPGSPGTLLKLYRDVPATEEYDVRESDLDAARAQWWRDLETEMARLDAVAGDVDPEVEADEVAEEEEQPPTPGQALGLLEHLLGAEVIDPDEGTQPR